LIHFYKRRKMNVTCIKKASTKLTKCYGTLRLAGVNLRSTDELLRLSGPNVRSTDFLIRCFGMSSVVLGLAPPKPVITVPIPVEKRALKRHQKIENLAKQRDKEKLKNKPLVISCKRKELNHRQGQTYGKNSEVPLASGGWKHNKSYDDYFTINSFQPIKAQHFVKNNEPSPKFSDLDIHPDLVKALENCGFVKLTNIQSESLSTILDVENKDNHTLIAAETGNGKTLCFLIPILQNIIKMKQNPNINADDRPHGCPIGLVVVPSRELAAQIGNVARDLGEQLGIRVDVMLGGRTMHQSENSKLKSRTDLVIGSFGGLYKMFASGFLRRQYVTEIALDEIDTLLDDTFKDSLTHFLQKFGQSNQTILQGIRIMMTGATFPTNFDTYMSEIIDLEYCQKFSTDQIHKVLYHMPQKFMRVAPSRKLDDFTNLMNQGSAKQKKTLIFCNKSSTANFLNHHLREHNFVSVNYNKTVSPQQRFKNYNEFANGEVDIMCTTDLASRGLDTKMVHHVINYDFPLNPADYIHRVGRAGRVGSVGGNHVTSLIYHPFEVDVLQRIELAARKNVEIAAVNNNIIRIIKHRAQKKEMSNFFKNENNQDEEM